MPELAEVEFMRRRWDAGLGEEVVGVAVHQRARVFRACDVAELTRGLTASVLQGSARSGKQMMFRFSGGWMGLHLGMTGELLLAEPGHVPLRHDHLVLRQSQRALVLRDPRMFGAVSFSAGDAAPEWWGRRPPEIVDRAFDRWELQRFLARRSRTVIKAVLLMQERFPGIGNWMADETLWRAGIHPARLAGSLGPEEVTSLHRSLKFVCREALRTVLHERNGSWGDPPHGWLFHARWSAGGRCPATGVELAYATIGGRTTCWSPARQPVASP